MAGRHPAGSRRSGRVTVTVSSMSREDSPSITRYSPAAMTPFASRRCRTGGEQPRIEGQRDDRLGVGLELDAAEAGEPLGRFPAAGDRRDVDLRHVAARQPSVILDPEADDQLLALEAGAQPVIVEVRVGQAVAEREKRLEPVGVVPAVADPRAFEIADRERLGPGEADAVEPRPRQLALIAREGDRKVTGRIDPSEQQVGDRLAAGRARVPDLEDAGDPLRPRHQHRPAGLQHGDGPRIGARHRLDQGVLIVRQGQRRVDRLGGPLVDEDQRDVALRGKPRGRLRVAAVTEGDCRIRRLRLDRAQRRGRIIDDRPGPARRRQARARHCRRPDRPGSIRRPKARRDRHGSR